MAVREEEGSTQSAGSLKILAIVPAYNEADKIAPVLLKLHNQVRDILVVDDGSTDLTSEVSGHCLVDVIRNEKNQGKGAALRAGFEWALDNGFDIIVTIDADGQHDPAELSHLIEPIIKGEADVVNGSRMKSENIPGYRRFGNSILNSMTRHASKSHSFISDSQSGFRAYSKAAIEKLIHFTANGMGVDSELAASAYRANLRIQEVPISIVYEDNSPTHHPLRHTADVMLSIVGDLAIKNPLRYLGIPGGIMLLAGFGLIAALIGDYLTKAHYFSLPFSILAMLVTVFGLLLLMTGLILYGVSYAINKSNNRERAWRKQS